MQPKKYKQTKAQILLQIHLRELGVETVPEFRFYSERRWRWDLCCMDKRIAFEISGGNWTGGHKRGGTQEDEYDKLNTGQMQGWKVFQFTNRQVLTGKAKEFLQQWSKA